MRPATRRRPVPGVRRGLSVMEITIVAALSSAILLSAMMIMGRTGRTFQKGSDLMNTQVLLDSIMDQLRSDVRGMRSLFASDCSDKKIRFRAYLKGREHVIEYLFDEQEKALYRTIDGPDGGRKDFHGAGQVMKAAFLPDKEWAKFRYLSLVLQVNGEAGKEEDRLKKAGSRLAIACQFHPRCLEARNSFAVVKKE